MDLADILEQLREQRDSLNAAISALEGVTAKGRKTPRYIGQATTCQKTA